MSFSICENEPKGVSRFRASSWQSWPCPKKWGSHRARDRKHSSFGETIMAEKIFRMALCSASFNAQGYPNNKYQIGIPQLKALKTCRKTEHNVAHLWDTHTKNCQEMSHKINLTTWQWNAKTAKNKGFVTFRV